MGSLDALLKAKGDLDKSAATVSAAAQYNDQKKDWLPRFSLSNCDITVRLTMDLKGQLTNEYCQYWINQVPVYDEATGEEKHMDIRHRVKGVWDARNGAYDYRSHDPLRQMATELGRLYPNPRGNQYSATLYNTIYADVVEARDAMGNVIKDAKGVKVGIDDKHRLGPCILQDAGWSRLFAVALKNSLDVLIRRASAKGKDVEERVASFFDPKKPGILCDIKRTPGSQGKSGTCTVTFDSESDGHLFAPEVIEKFADIKNEGVLKFDAVNERNREILMEHFKRLLSKGEGSYASPDPIRTRKPISLPLEDDGGFNMDSLNMAQASGR